MSTESTSSLPQQALAQGHPYPRLRRFAIDAAFTACFNVVIAVFVTYVIGIHNSFMINLVISMAIGMLAVTFVDGGRLLLWGLDKPPILPFLLLLGASIIASQFLGNHIASLILGIPVESFAAVRAKNETGFLFLFIFVFAFITWFFWNRSVIEQLRAEAEAEKARTAAIEKQAMQAQLQMLQAQIEPHMLFNTLANLQSLISIDPQRAQHMLDQLIQYLRATLTSSRARQITLAQEFALLDAYLGLMSVRMGSRLTYALDLPPDLKSIPIPPMLLQPLVENAIKHGLEPKIDGGRITVQACKQDALLELIVMDDGLGLNEPYAGDAKGASLGLINVQDRLHALFGNSAAFSLQSNHPQGAIARMTIPVAT